MYKYSCKLGRLQGYVLVHVRLVVMHQYCEIVCSLCILDVYCTFFDFRARLLATRYQSINQRLFQLEIQTEGGKKKAVSSTA